MKTTLFWAFAIILLFTGCNPDRIYEQYQEVNGAWSKDQTLTFSFLVSDVSQSYDLTAHFKHDRSYEFYNFYYQYQLSDQQGNTVKKELKEIIFFDPKTGKPLGSGLGNTFTHQQNFLEDFTFPDSGNYQLTLWQFMRRDTLLAIDRVGVQLSRSVN
jgi:gliding motility-associated lipoprotein GldH